MIDFPNSPTNGQVFTNVNTSWIYDGSKWVAGNNPAAFLPLTGGTLTGQTRIAPASGWSSFVLVKPSSGNSSALYGYLGANARWQLDLGNATTEGGGNSGSDFMVSRYNDAGAYLDSPLLINRATGVLLAGGPIGAGSPVSPGGFTQALWTGMVITGWVGFNAYVNAASTQWLHKTGTGYAGDFELNAGVFTWYIGAQVAKDAAVTMNVVAQLTSVGTLTVPGDVYSANHIVKNGSTFGYYAQNSSSLNAYVLGINASNQVILGNGSYGIMAQGAFQSTSTIASTGTGSMIQWTMRDNTSVSWGWYALAGLARLWYSPLGDILSVDTNGAVVSIGQFRSSSGRIVSVGSSNPSVCVYNLGGGYAAGMFMGGVGTDLYFGQMDGNGSYSGTAYAHFDTSGLLHMNAAGISYESAVYGSLHAFAFGWYTNSYSGLSCSISNGAAWIPIQSASDARMKTEIVPSTLDALGIINQIQLRQFRWIDVSDPTSLKSARENKKAFSPLKRIGVIAQEVAEIFPEGVIQGDDHEDKLGAVWSIDQNIMIAALIGAVQELSAEVQALREKVG